MLMPNYGKNFELDSSWRPEKLVSAQANSSPYMKIPEDCLVATVGKQGTSKRKFRRIIK